MNRQKRCPKCGYVRYWKIRRGKRKCVKCRYEYPARNTRLNLTRKQWREIIKWFVLEQSIDRIVEQTYISRYKVIKVLTHVRRLMLSALPEIFDGFVEVDETYIGGQWKNKRKVPRKLLGLKGGVEQVSNRYLGYFVYEGKFGLKLFQMWRQRHYYPCLREELNEVQ